MKNKTLKKVKYDYIQCCYCKANSVTYPIHSFYNIQPSKWDLLKGISYGCEICKNYNNENKTN